MTEAELNETLAALGQDSPPEWALAEVRELVLRPRRWWPWLVPVPVMVAIALLTFRVPEALPLKVAIPQPAAPVVAVSKPAPAIRRAPKPRPPDLFVKLVTDDPNVVIFWSVDSQGGS
jgi:hypothetical protein